MIRHLYTPENNSLPPALDVSDVAAVMSAAGRIDYQVRALVVPAAGPARRKECYLTYATPEYALGLTVLLRSLRRHSERPIVVLVDRVWTFKSDVPNVFFVLVPRLGNSRYAPERHEIRATLTKLWAFGLVSLDRVVFLDADCLVLRSIDDLFELSGLWCPPDYVEDAASTRFNSGMMAFDPTPSLRDKIYAGAHLAPSYDHGDQGLLNSLVFSEVNFLPPEYSVARHYGFFHGAEMRPADVRVIHYIVKKPWDLWYRETPDLALCDLDDKWTAELDHPELLALVSQWRRRQFNVERSRLESLRQHRSRLAVALANRKIRYLAAAVVFLFTVALVAGSVAILVDALAAILG